MKKWIIVANGIAIVIAILVIAMISFTFTQEPEASDPGSGNAGPPLTEELSGTSDGVRTGSQTPRSIEEVKEAWEEQLMAVPGVMGVGISLTKDGQEKAIKVYVDRQASAQAAQIPKEIEGYPVEVEIRGTFRVW